MLTRNTGRHSFPTRFTWETTWSAANHCLHGYIPRIFANLVLSVDVVNKNTCVGISLLPLLPPQSPWDAYLLHRSVKTLAVRMDRQNERIPSEWLSSYRTTLRSAEGRVYVTVLRAACFTLKTLP